MFFQRQDGRFGAAADVQFVENAADVEFYGGQTDRKLIRDFGIPSYLMKARVSSATMISPKGERVEMPIEGGYVGMVDRSEFDEYLRERAEESGATRYAGTY